MTDNKKHVQIPNGMTKEHRLTPNDILVYACIKSFDNPQAKCYPSIRKIAELASMSVPTVKKSIEALELEGYIKTQVVKKRTYYTFDKYKTFEIFSFDFLNNKELTHREKAYILVTQQHMYKKGDTQTGVVAYSDRKLADLINMPRASIQKCNNSLIEKGLLKIADDCEVSAKKGDKVFDLAKLGQALVFVLQNHEERLTDGEIERRRMLKMIEELQEKVAKMEGEKSGYITM
jgi:DNA-binding transcriptional regulator YhcF (GntR family)